MTPAQRIHLARRHSGLSQAKLARVVGVHRSAVSHWEAPNAKSPSTGHLCEIARATDVNFEWLATGRGAMGLSSDVRLDSIAAVDALLVDDTVELRLLKAFRDATAQSRIALVEIAEQLAVARTGQIRIGRARAPLTTPLATTEGSKRPLRGEHLGALLLPD